MMKIVLETKKFCKDLQGKTKEDEIFYRYDIDGNTVWFAQHQLNGNIYAVYVRLKEPLDKYFSLWVHCEDHRLFYPEYAGVEMNRRRISKNEVEDLISDIKYINKLRDMIMSIFKLDEHYKLWSKHNVMKDGNHCELCGEDIETEHLKVCDKCASEYRF